MDPAGTPLLTECSDSAEPSPGPQPPHSQGQNVPNAAPAGSQAGPTRSSPPAPPPSSRPPPGPSVVTLSSRRPRRTVASSGAVLVGWGWGQPVTKRRQPEGLPPQTSASHCSGGWKRSSGAARSGGRWGPPPTLARPTRGRVVWVAAGGGRLAWGRPSGKRRSSETHEVTPLSGGMGEMVSPRQRRFGDQWGPKHGETVDQGPGPQRTQQRGAGSPLGRSFCPQLEGH